MILWQNDRNAGQRNCCFHCLLTGHSRLRSRPLGFEPCVRKKKKQILSYLLTLVDHQGFDRQLRVARRLPPQLPYGSFRNVRCENVHRTFSLTLTPSRVRTLRQEKEKSRYFRICLLWWIIRGSNPGHPD